jgi:hypothetical protein
MKTALKFDNNSCVMIITRPSGLLGHPDIAKIFFCDQDFNIKADGPKHILTVPEEKYHYQIRSRNLESFVPKSSTKLPFISFRFTDNVSVNIEGIKLALEKFDKAVILTIEESKKISKTIFSIEIERKKKVWWQRYNGRSTVRFSNLDYPLSCGMDFGVSDYIKQSNL